MSQTGERGEVIGVCYPLSTSATHNRVGDSRYSTRLSIDELHAFADQIRSLPCIIKEERLVEEMFRKVRGNLHQIKCSRLVGVEGGGQGWGWECSLRLFRNSYSPTELPASGLFFPNGGGGGDLL